MHNQQGQTLVETVVAIFILVMGITAALGLAIYSLNASSEINKQIVAIGLAREGIEAVKNMRDTNWLHDTLSENCHNFNDEQPSNTYCYRNWLGTEGLPPVPYDLSGAIGKSEYALTYSSSSNQFWQLIPTSSFGLNYSESDLDSGFYSTDGTVSFAEATSDYARAVILESDDFPPFNHAGDLGPRVKVTSVVWWKGTKCPVVETPPLSGGCSIVLETYLTNWRNY